MSTPYTDRPAVAVLTTTGSNVGPHTAICLGYWQPDGTWADVDGGPGAVGLRETISGGLSTWAPKRKVCIDLIVLSMSGEQTEPRSYSRDDLATLELPTDPGERRCVYAATVEDTEHLVQAPDVEAVHQHFGAKLDNVRLLSASEAEQAIADNRLALVLSPAPATIDDPGAEHAAETPHPEDEFQPELIISESIEPGDVIDLDDDGKPYGEPRTVAFVRQIDGGCRFYVEFSDEDPGASFAFDESVWLVFRPDVQGMAEAAEERMHDDLDVLLRREVDAALGHGNWTGDVDPPLVAAFHLHLIGVLRQLIQNGVPAGVKPAAEPEPEPKFTISIDLASQGMRTASDVADVLVALGEHLRETEQADEAPVRDAKGNTVGHWCLVLPEQPKPLGNDR